MLSTEARAELERLTAGDGTPATLAQRRRAWEAAARLQVLPRGARFASVMAADVPAEWMDMPHVWRDRVLLLLHGGGFCMGSPRTHRLLAAELGRSLHMRVLTPDYRLAPEHPFPAGVTDALRAYGWLLSQGFAEEQIVVGGDSAGGGMVLSMLLALRSGGGQMPRAAILMSPWTDLTCSSPSHKRLRGLDRLIRREDLLEAAGGYTGKRDPAGSLLSPLFADLTGLPPMAIHAGTNEVLLDDAGLFADRAAEAGVKVMFKAFDGMWHAFHHAGSAVPEARQAIDELGVFVRGFFRTREARSDDVSA